LTRQLSDGGTAGCKEVRANSNELWLKLKRDGDITWWSPRYAEKQVLHDNPFGVRFKVMWTSHE